MRKEIERRPVDTKVLRENFRRGLERNMNKLMSKGYEPVGGISTHMNTHTKPILGIDSQEYTQTMVKYESFEVWIKDSDAEREAYNDEQTSESLHTQIKNVKTGATKDIKRIKHLEEQLAESEEKPTSAKKSFLENFRSSLNASKRGRRMEQLKDTKESLSNHKLRHDKLNKEVALVDSRLARFYKSNPSVTRDILMNSR